MENSKYRCDQDPENRDKAPPLVDQTVLTDKSLRLLAGAKLQEELLETLGVRQSEDCHDGATRSFPRTMGEYNCVVRHDCPKLSEHSVRNMSTALPAYGTVEDFNCVNQNWLEKQCKLERTIHIGTGMNNQDAVPNYGSSIYWNRSHESEQNDAKEDSMDDTLIKFRTNEMCMENQLQDIFPTTYRLEKGKVSKWTKVKAAFKWERADLFTLAEATKEYGSSGIDRIPHNREVARYLRVPMVSHGGSSPESMVSSSSGPMLLSETGDTPGSISLASSMDDIYDSPSRIKTPNTARCVGLVDVEKPKCSKEVLGSGPEIRARRISKEECKVFKVPDSTCVHKVRKPPKPLTLELKQDLSDLDGTLPGTQVLKSPHKVTSAASNRVRKISSPGNSSVPSSPSRNSDVFAEFESEDISSSEFSEPSTTNVDNTQDEINRRYQLLQRKLDKEFAMKLREWEKQKTNPNSCRAITLKTSNKSEELSPNLILGSTFCADFFEENLTPDFKKKLRKWRVKKQTTNADGRLSPSPAIGQIPMDPVSSNKDKSIDSKAKTKNLPEEFQRKLDQWDKMKRNGGSSSDSFKRKSSHEKEVLDRLAKLRPAAAEVEVKTSIGVIKFEGISRKFTRKLYEWEKARGIGPESSTFALLHPGYCPIDVDQITKDCCKNAEHSPTISRTLSLDSVALNSMACGNSQRASSMSLNNIHELRDLESMSTTNDCTGDAFKKFLRHEPEAVMVEVEDDIVETARQLITTHSLVEKEIPVYKYEQVSCNDFCNTKRVKSFESFTNLAPLLSVLKHTDDVLGSLKKTSPDIMENVEIRHCVEILTYIRLIYPHYSQNLIKPKVLNAIIDVQAELERITNLSQRAPLDEACCREILEERYCEYNEEFMGLRESLELLRSGINGGSSRYHLDIVPDINITSEDNLDSSAYAPTTVEASTDDFICSEQVPNHNFNADMASVGGVGANMGTKKKLRLRKVGSRQNSKTESSDNSETESSVIDTPRRLKRKTFRTKQRSFEETELLAKNELYPNENVENGLKVKPCEPVELYENKLLSGNFKKLESANDKQLHPIMTNSTIDAVEYNETCNVFVKTKRKVFTTIKAPSFFNGIAVVGRDIEDSPSEPSELELPTVLEEELETPEKQEDCQIWRPLIKSFSLDTLQRNIERPIERYRYVSAGHLLKLNDTARMPLASDSLQIIEKSIPKQRNIAIITSHAENPDIKSHCFKKNTEKSNSGATLKKIGSKIVKSFQSNSRDIPTGEAEKFNEQARRLQKAKDHLLQSIYGSDGPCCSTEVSRLSCSDINGPGVEIMSVKNKDVSYEDKKNLLKSVSAGAFKTTAPSDTQFVAQNSTVVTRSAKFSSKLGFACLASKFRRVKGKKALDIATSSNTISTVPKEGALSTLCRQSLLAEGVAMSMHFQNPHNGIVGAVQKSHSSPIAGGITEQLSDNRQVDIRPQNDDKCLNKSQSEQLVMNRNKSIF